MQTFGITRPPSMNARGIALTFASWRLLVGSFEGNFALDSV